MRSVKKEGNSGGRRHLNMQECELRLNSHLDSGSNNIHGVGNGGGCCCCHWSCQGLQNQMGALAWCQQGQLLCYVERKQL